MSRPNNYYQFIPGWQPLNFIGLNQSYPDNINRNWLSVLSSKDLSVLLSLVNMVVPWYWLWQIPKADLDNRQSLLDYKAELEKKLMAVLSIDDLIKTQLMMVAAITGEVIDRDHPENYMTGSYDPAGVEPTLAAGNTAQHTDLAAVNTTIGTTNSRLSTINTTIGTTNTNLGTINTTIGNGNTAQHTDLAAIKTALDAIKTALDTISGADDLENELTAIAGQLTAIVTTLGI